MCGIFAILNYKQGWNSNVKEQFIRGIARGPESSYCLEYDGQGVLFGFHRLAINGVNEQTDKPLADGNVNLICNGEIYNYKELFEYLDITPNTDSDCEIIIHLYKKYGITRTVELLNGVYAFALLDTETSELFIARDTYGVRPLFTGRKDNEIAFASEVKMLHPM